MSFDEYLTISAQQVNLHLEEVFKTWSKELTGINPLLLPLAKNFITATQGGKRIRGVLVKFGYELATTNHQPQATDILSASAAFEIFQTAILAHDDIIDKSPLRRGQPSLYQALGGDHYGISQTICLGDLGFFLANQLIIKSDFPESAKLKGLAVFSQLVTDTIIGEMIDVDLPSQPEVGEADILQLAKLKTAQYTTTGPLSLGAVLAGANPELLAKVKQFGDNLGVAFQIQDDILGIFGDEAKMGKSATSDIEEGKNTLLSVYAGKKANLDHQTRLKALYGHGPVNQSEVEEIQAIFKESGALDYAQSIALEYVDRSKKVIPELTSSSEHQELLKGLAELLVNRQK